jgi:hypothetical protein
LFFYSIEVPGAVMATHISTDFIHFTTDFGCFAAYRFGERRDPAKIAIISVP